MACFCVLLLQPAAAGWLPPLLLLCCATRLAACTHTVWDCPLLQCVAGISYYVVTVLGAVICQDASPTDAIDHRCADHTPFTLLGSNQAAHCGSKLYIADC